MWPWTHLAFGYLAHSVTTRVAMRRPPSDGPVLVALFASILPDLVDKPLSWTIGVTNSGYGPLHSIFVGFPLVVVLALFVGWYRGRVEYAIALLAGYTSHLVGDLIFQYAAVGRFIGGVIGWPLAPPLNEAEAGTLDQVAFYLLRFVTGVRDGTATGYALLTLAILVGVLVLWVRDGKPGLRWVVGHGSGDAP